MPGAGQSEALARTDRSSERSFLKRERYIRYAGILLTLSPIGNFLWSAASAGAGSGGHWYHLHALALIFTQLPAVLWFLWGLTFLAGVLMLKGKRSSWNFTLFILGVNIAFGITTFSRDIQGGWFQPTLSLVINFSLFVLVYVQEFHQRLERKLLAAREALAARDFSTARGPAKPPRKSVIPQESRAPRESRVPSPAPAPAPTVTYELPVHFEGIGPWAKIAEITHAGIRVRSVDGEAPRQIEFRPVELALAPGLVLKARFSDKIGSDFIFRFTDMDPVKLALLRRWTQQISARASGPRSSTASVAARPHAKPGTAPATGLDSSPVAAPAAGPDSSPAKAA